MTRTIDLNSQEWRNLVFANKNQAYGAYEIRKTSSKRHLMSLSIVMVLVMTFFAFPIAMKKLFPTEIPTAPTTDGVIIFAEYNIPEKREIIEITKPATPVVNLKSTVKFTPPIITKEENVTEEMPSQGLLSSTDAIPSTQTFTGNPGGTVDPTDVAPVAPPKTDPFVVVEQMPEFIGGDKELMSYLSKNTKYPILALESGVQGTVVIRFVVDKDGHIADVIILRSLDPHCDKEAIRVVKSMKDKWIPGRQNGNKVDVYFTLPIKFQLNG